MLQQLLRSLLYQNCNKEAKVGYQDITTIKIISQFSMLKRISPAQHRL